MVAATNGAVRLPRSFEAEEAVVGALLIWPVKFAEVQRVLPPSYFSHPACRFIYEAMVELDHHGKPIDSLTVLEQMRALETEDRLRAFNGPDYLTELMAKVVTIENVAYYAHLVARCAQKRRAYEQLRAFSEAALTDDDAPELLERVSRWIEDSRGHASDIDNSLKLIQIGKVEEATVTAWLVESLWAKEGVGIVAGEPKSYKSFLTAYLATCIAAGKSALTRYSVAPGRVLMFNAEDKPQTTRRRIAAMCRALEVDLATLDLHLIDVPALRLDDAQQVQRLRATVERLRPSLLVLDPLRNLHDLDENDAGAVNALLAPLRLIQRDYQCAVMLVHHMAKLTDVQRRAGQRMRGSSALHGWVDSALYLSIKDNVITVQPEHRDAPVQDKFSFAVRETESNEGPLLWLEATAESQEEGQALTAIKERVLEALRKEKQPAAIRRIRSLVPGKGQTVDAAVSALAGVGAIELVEHEMKRANGRPYTYSGWQVVRG